MRVLSKLYLFSLIISLSSCGPQWHYKSPAYVAMGDKIIHNSAVKLAKKHNIRIIGNSGRMMYCISEMGIMFQIFRPITRDEARKLLIDCALEFLDDINANHEIHPYLSNVPFTPRNVEIKIFSSNSDGSDVYDPFIEVVGTNNGKVTFATSSPINKYGYENFYVETFEEALEKVKNQ